MVLSCFLLIVLVTGITTSFLHRNWEYRYVLGQVDSIAPITFRRDRDRMSNNHYYFSYYYEGKKYRQFASLRKGLKLENGNLLYLEIGIDTAVLGVDHVSFIKVPSCFTMAQQPARGWDKIPKDSCQKNDD